MSYTLLAYLKTIDRLNLSFLQFCCYFSVSFFSVFLLGTPRNHLAMTEIINLACTDATHYKNAGVVSNYQACLHVKKKKKTSPDQFIPLFTTVMD